MKTSVIEAAYEHYLIEMGINYVREFKVFTGESRNVNSFGKGVRQVRNVMRFDFYLPDTHTVIELDDDNHYRGGCYEYVHKTDLKKDEIAEKLGLDMVRIDVRNETKYLFNLRMHVYGGYKKKYKGTAKSDVERLNNCHSWFRNYIEEIGVEEYLSRPCIKRYKKDNKSDKVEL